LVRYLFAKKILLDKKPKNLATNLSHRVTFNEMLKYFDALYNAFMYNKYHVLTLTFLGKFL